MITLDRMRRDAILIIEEESNLGDSNIKHLLNTEGRKLFLINGSIKTLGQSKNMNNHTENNAVRIILKRGNLIYFQNNFF
jgi:hypothetical protein